MSAEVWSPAPVAHKYGGALLTSAQPNPSAAAAGVTQAAGPAEHGAHAVHVLSPHHPFVWLAGIAAVSVGLAAASTTARIGPVKASLTAGKE